VSVIAHWIEQAGISTVVIGLVRDHMVKIKPPRALWVPFELGRPIGAPANPAFQTQVLQAALSMVSQPATAAMLTDFDEDDPRSVPDDQWQAPLQNQCSSVAGEVAALESAYAGFVRAKARTTVGVAKIDIEDCAALVDNLGHSEPQISQRSDVSPVLMTRLAIDDLKAYYTEAALQSGSPSSAQIQHWFWQQTRLGAELQRLRMQWMSSENGKVQKLGELFLVPHRWRQT
jgi:hypothetical protein